MQYETVKSEKIPALDFVKHAVIVNGQVKSLEITIGGKPYLIQSSWGDLSLGQPKPDTIVTKWRVSGSVYGAEIKERTFDTEREAKFYSGDFPSSSAELKIEPIQWNESQDTQHDGAPVSAPKSDEDLPF